jgi:hypothetical protein
MNWIRAFRRSLQILVAALFLANCFALTANPAQKPYIAKDPGEVEVLFLVLSAEVKANNWTTRDSICFSVDAADPDKKLVKDLRRRGLDVRSTADWGVDFTCAFRVDLRFTSSDSSQEVRIRAEVNDLRQINSGQGRSAILIRNGEYRVRKREGKWSVAEYVPGK